jgi:uncharacterized protein (TIGR03437 family)
LILVLNLWEDPAMSSKIVFMLPALLWIPSFTAQAQPTFTISTVAGNGTAGFSGDGGPAASAEMNSPYMAAVDPAGNLYIADFNNNRIRKVTPAGVISTFAGTGAAGFGGDGGPATSAKLYMPSSVFFDNAGNLFIADQFNGRVRKVTPAGIISTVAGPGPYQGYCGDGGPATSACLNGPIDAVTDASGNLYIAEFDSNAIRKVNTNGIISTVAGGNVTAGYAGDGGPATAASLSGPTGVAVSTTGDVFIGDGGNDRIRKVTNGVITTFAGTGKAGFSGDGGPAPAAQLNFPGRIRLDAAGNLYFADGRNNRIRLVLAANGTISTVAGNGTSGYTGDGGPATSAEIGAGGISVSASGNVYVASNNRIRLLTPASVQAPQFTISTVAGNGTTGYSGDGGTATSAEINGTNGLGVVADAAGDFYIADYGNNRVRKVSQTGTISTVAGNGTAGFSGDGGPATSSALRGPAAVAIDMAGNLYIADTLNNRIRKMTNGTITTIAGTGTAGFSGDGGPALSAEFNGPTAVALDAAGNLYIVDTRNNRIRMVTPGGTISSVAGNGQADFAGDGGAATSAALNTPLGLAANAGGDLFIADTTNSRIRKVSKGIITTVAGNGTAGYAGDGGSGTAAQINFPTGVSVDSAGNLYIADLTNSRIRELLANGTIWTIAGGVGTGFGGDGGPATNAKLNGAGALAIGLAGDVYIGDAFNERIRLLTPVPSAPSITAGGVVSASGFGGFSSVAPGSWVELYGTNLASTTRSWTAADFSGTTAPTSLSGTSVSIGDQPAFIDYISPTQVNVQVPSNIATGPQPLTVTAATGTSTAYTINVSATEPGLLAPSSFLIGGTQYIVALFTDGVTYVLPPGAITGVTSQPAKPGDAIVLYGIGFGATTPNIPAGQIAGESNTLTSSFQLSIGGQPATVEYSGLAPGFVGLYQFNVTVPNVAAGNAVPVTFTLNSISGTQTLSIAIQN